MSATMTHPHDLDEDLDEPIDPDVARTLAIATHAGHPAGPPQPGPAKSADELADIIRSSAAWWRLAAEQLENGDAGQAVTFARLGEFGLEGMADRIRQLTR